MLSKKYELHQKSVYFSGENDKSIKVFRHRFVYFHDINLFHCSTVNFTYKIVYRFIKVHYIISYASKIFDPEQTKHGVD